MLLIDTNVLAWLLEDNPKLGALTRQLLGHEETIHMSVASIWEARLKQRRHGNFDIDGYERFVSSGALELIPLQGDHVETMHTHRSSIHHNDPFDLVVIAVAIHEGMTLVTSDQTIIDLKVSGLTVLDSRI